MKWFAGILVIVGILAGAVYLFGDKLASAGARKQLDENIAEFQAENEDTSIEYGEVTGGLARLLGSDDSGKVKDLVIKSDNEEGQITIESADIDLFDMLRPENWTPSSMNTFAHGIRIETPEAIEQFSDLGLEDPSFDVDLETEYSEEELTFEFKTLRFAAEELAAVNLKWKMGGFPEDFSTMSSNPLMAAGGLTLHHFEISFEDDGLVNLLMGQAQEETGEDREALINGIMTDMNSDDDMAASFYAPIEDFLRNPKTLTISAYPETPVSLMQLVMSQQMGSSPMDLVKSLGISISNR